MSGLTISQALEGAINKEFSPTKVLARILLRKIKEAGIRLSAPEKRAIQESCEQAWSKGDFSKLKKLPIRRNGRKDVSISIGVKEIDEFVDQANKKIEEALPSLLERISRKIYPKYRENAEFGRLGHVYTAERFRTRLARTYRKPFMTLGRFVAACIDAGQTVLDSLASENGQKQTPTLVALLRLHHRGCRIATEMECLLHAGLSDGALARWRTLHEICVCAAFIRKEGDEVASRFLRHEGFERSKLDRSRSQTDSPHMEGDGQVVALLKSTYGVDYLSDYGWSAKALGKARVTFRDLENATSFGHVRLLYQQSSNAVHASSLSLTYRPSLDFIAIPGDPMEWAIVTNIGLTKPADLCAWSLLNVTMALLGTSMSADHIVHMHLLNKIKTEVATDFARAESRIMARERKLETKRSDDQVARSTRER